MPVLYQKLLELQPWERDMLPLMECLTTLLGMIKQQGVTWAKGLFDKSMQVGRGRAGHMCRGRGRSAGRAQAGF